MRSLAAYALLVGATIGCSNDPITPGETYAELVTSDDPLAYWRFEEASGAIVNDASGNNNRGELVGAPERAQSFSTATGNAFAYNDDTDGVVSMDSAWSSLENLTVEAWIRPHQVTSQEGMIIVDKGSTWNLFITPNGFPAFQYPGGVPPTTVANQAVQVGATYHLVGTIGDGVMRLYVNGDLADEANVGPIDNRPEHLHVGRGLTLGSFDFYGLIDEVAVYDHVLSGQAVLEHYNAGR